MDWHHSESCHKICNLNHHLSFRRFDFYLCLSLFTSHVLTWCIKKCDMHKYNIINNNELDRNIFSLDRTQCAQPNRERERARDWETMMNEGTERKQFKHQRERTCIEAYDLFTSSFSVFARWLYRMEIDWYFSFDKRFYNSIKSAASLECFAFVFFCLLLFPSLCFHMLKPSSPSPVAIWVLSAFIVIWFHLDFCM